MDCEFAELAYDSEQKRNVRICTAWIGMSCEWRRKGQCLVEE